MRQQESLLVRVATCVIIVTAIFQLMGGCRRAKESESLATMTTPQKSYNIDRIDSSDINNKNKKSPPGELRILSATPSGQTASPHEAETVVVIFDRPIVPLQPLDRGASVSASSSSRSSPSPDHHPAPTLQPYLRFDPPTEGRYRWIGTRTLAFSPARRFPFATDIKVTVPAGLPAIDGSRLPQDFSWSFQTIEPRLVRHFPADGQRWLRLDTEVLLLFNQPMDKDKASAFISWVAFFDSPSSLPPAPAFTSPFQTPETQKAPPPRPHALTFAVTHPSPDRLKTEGLDLPPENALLLTLSPGQKLLPATTCRLTLKQGLPGREGPLGLIHDYSFSFETFGPFYFLGLVEPPPRKTDESTTPPHSLTPPSSTLPPSPRPPSRPLPPDASLQLKFSNPVSYRELVSRLAFDPPVEIPDYYAEWDYSNADLYLSLPLAPETAYTLRLPADLVDEFGNKLGQPIALPFRTGSFPASVTMTTGYGVIESSAISVIPTPSYPLEAINQPSVFVQAARLARDAVIPLLRQPKLFWSNQKFAARPGFFQLEKTLLLNLAPNKRRTVPVNLGELLPPASRHALIFLQVDTTIPEATWDRYLKVFLQVTELGLSAKFSPENNVIWVTELKTGLPVPGASLEIRDDQNTVRWRGQTDASGKAEAPGWKKLGLSRGPNEYDEPRQWVFATRDSDVAFISSEWGTGLDPYRFHIDYDWLPEPSPFQGYLFTERGIYRAGEKAHIKGIIREKIKGEWRLPSPPSSPSVPLPLTCEIRDPLNKVVFKGPLTLDDFGSFALDFATAEDFSLGQYQITATIPSRRPGVKSPEATFSGSFRLEAFRPAEFEVHLRSAAPSFIFSRDYEAEIRANYLFGGAMAGQEVDWTLRLNRTSFSPPGHPGFIFGNELDWDEDEVEPAESRLLASGHARLDAEGRLPLKLPLVAAKEKDSVLATLEATVTSPSHKAISNRIQSLVHRGEFYVGLKPSTSLLRKGDSLAVEVIAASPDGRLLPGRKVAVKLVRREWRSVRQAGVGGRFRWRSEREDIEIETRGLETSGAAASTVSFTPEKSGFYFLLASSTDGRQNPITTTTSFYVTGPDYVPWDRSDDDAIELVPDATSYRPGDRARLLVKSPYERAKALVTIEREFVLESRVVEIEGTASTIEIPIRSEHIPNVFVSVLLVHGRTEVPAAGSAAASPAASPPALGSAAPPLPTEDVSQPSFKIGYVNLPVDPAEKKLSILIDNPKPEYRPRDKVTLKFKVDPPSQASLAIAVVDVGVLSLIGYETPDPFSAFYGQRPLSVRTSETRLHVVGLREYGEKGEEPGGGGALREMAALAPPGEVELRGDFKSTAYWNPSLLTDLAGEATVTFTLPDNLTTFRVMAVAQTRDSRFGWAETSFRVSKKLLLQPSLPRFLRVGDAIEAGVVVHNFSSRKGKVTVDLTVDGLRLLGQDEKKKDGRSSFTLNAGQSREALFSLKAETPGQAILTFRARLGPETDGLELKLPVHLPRPTETVALSGEVPESGTVSEERLFLPLDAFPERSRLEVEAAATALAGLKGNLDYLVDYPYACLEQRLSAILPYIVGGRLLVDFKLTPLTDKDIRSLVRTRLKEVLSFQKEDGGFSAWPDSDFTSPFLTCYAAFALTKAREAGYEVDPASLDSASAYLVNFLRSRWEESRYPYAERTWMTTRAYAVYVLSLLGKPQPAHLERLLAEREKLSLFARTLVLKAVHHGRGPATARALLLNDLRNKIKVTPTEAHFEDDEGRDGRWIYASNGRTTALILQTLIELGEDHPLLGPAARWLIKRQQATSGGRLASTQENFYLLYGLSAFYGAREAGAADFLGKITLANRPLLAERFGPGAREVKRASLDLADFMETDAKSRPDATISLPLRIEKTGTGTLYYGARLTYAPMSPAEPRDEGMAVLKTIEPLDSRDRTSRGIEAGSLVVVTVEVAVPQESLYVVIDDPLPAGLEAVNPAFRTESEEAGRRLQEISAASDVRRRRRSWPSFNHVEIHDDRVLLFADILTPGLHTHRYLARALSFGTYTVPGTKAEEMYAPEVFGRSQELIVKVAK